MINKYLLKYFIATIKTHFFLVTLVFILSLFYEKDLIESRTILIFLIPTSIAVITLIHTYQSIKPIKRILLKIDTLFKKIPKSHGNNYLEQTEDWATIDEMLTSITNFLDNQNEAYENQILQADTLLKAIPTATVIVDQHYNCKQYNQLFLCDFIKEENLNKFNSEKIWKIFKNSLIEKLFKDALDNKKSGSLQGFFMVNLNKYFDITVTILADRHNKTIGALGIFHDVTKAKLTEKMRVDFVANVSHEIRTPLTSIKGYAQLLGAKKDKISDNLNPILEKINNNTERLNDLFNNLLNLSIIESQQEIKKENIDFKVMLLSVEESLKGKYLTKNFSLLISLERDSLYGDPKMLEQVFTNLMDNAIKYSKEKPIIKISSKKENSFDYISFTDNGPGIPKEGLSRIFERFYRTESGISNLAEGTGLGLSIVKHIVNKHHGEISVQSDINQGTSFIIKIPSFFEAP